MNLRRKTFLMIALTQIIMIVIIFFSSQYILMDNYMTLEKERAETNAKRALGALSSTVSELSNKAYDWAQWDDTYNFIQDNNTEYAKINLLDSTFTSLKINVLLFINSTGSIVYGKAFSFESMTETPVPPKMVELIAANDSLWYHSSVESTITGVIAQQETPVLIASKPIITSTGEGPIRGALIMGVFLDFQTIKYLSDLLYSPVAINAFNETSLPPSFSSMYSSSVLGDSPIYTHQQENNSISGYALIRDVYGDFSLTLSVDTKMDIYQQGQNSVYFILLSYIGSGLLIGTITVYIVEKGLLSRIDGLVVAVKNMGKSKSFLQRLEWEKKDELSLLATTIDSMVEERFNAISELAGMVGHDLRNPLTGIYGAAYFLDKKYSAGMDVKGKEMLGVIKENVEFSNKIVSDLLDYSRSVQLELTETTLKQVLNESLAQVNIPTNVKLLLLTEDSTQVKMDLSKVKRVFINIIKNAVDAMPDGGTLTVKSERTGNEVRTSFSDTGLGISKENMEKLFTPLFTTKAKGMGFGLAICKRIIDAHGGKICVESEEGKGTTFTIILPVRKD